MKSKKSLFIVLGVGALLAAILVYNYVYQDHRDIQSEAPAFTVSATELSAAFEQDETSATQTYLNKTILVTGMVSTIDNETAMMEPSIFFALSENQQLPEKKAFMTEVQIKGRCIGYDSILEEIKFDQSVIIH